MAIPNEKVFNAIRRDLSAEFKDKIDVATAENIKQLGDIIIDYPTHKNEFINALMNKVAQTVINIKSYKSKYAEFRKERLNYGESIEMIFFDMVKGKNFNENFKSNDASEGTGNLQESLLAMQHNNNVGVQYVTQNYKVKWKETITNVEFRKMFYNENGLMNFVNAKIQAILNSIEHNEELAFLGCLMKMPTVEITVPRFDESTQSYRNLIKKVQELSLDMPFASNKYNPQGVMTWTNIEDMRLFLTPKAQTNINIDVLAGLFHVEKAELKDIIRTVPQFMKWDDATNAFVEDKKCIGKLIDKDAIEIRETESATGSFENPDRLYTNLFWHKQGLIYGKSFVNCVSLMAP